MSTKHNQAKRYYSEYETVGNTARKLNMADEQPFDSEVRREKEVKRHRQPKLHHDMDLVTVLVLVASIAVAVYLCVDYLKVQSDIVQIKKQIISLENDLENINDINDTLSLKIESAVDLEYVYDIAVNELGMVFANENDILNYKKSYNSYVRQYEVIDKSSEGNLLGELFNE